MMTEETLAQEVEVISEDPEEGPEQTQEYAIKEENAGDESIAARVKRACREVPQLTKSATRKTKVSSGPVRKGRKAAQATPPADPDDAVVVVVDDLQNAQSKKSVQFKPHLTVTHVISPVIVPGRNGPNNLRERPSLL